MAVNLAIKYSPKVAERFSQTALTQEAVNDDYDFDGVTTINIYSVDTVAMGTYTRSGTSRYGTPTELGTTKQALTLARDRAFTTTIDRRNNDESMGVTDAAKFLARQVREVITPEIDVYRLAALNTAAIANGKSTVVTPAPTTASNAYSNFLTLNGSISDLLVPSQGRIAFMTAGYYNFLKQSNFVLDSEAAYKDRKSGNYGTVDGVRIVVVPASYMPANTDLIVTHPSAMVSPLVLTDYITHKNAPGINGWLVEGRVVYDAFVLTTKVNAIATHRYAV
jgi:hypothetical protein